MKSWLSLVAFAIAGSLLGSAQAGTVQAGDTIIGVFDSIVFQGCLWNGPGASNKVCGIDNASTAPPFVSTSIDPGGGNPQATGSTLRWGTETSGAVPPSENFSLLTFQGRQVPMELHSDCSTANIVNCFKVGTISFVNGSSQNDSIIFGATLNFYDNSVSPTNSLGSMDVLISSTQNIGTPAQNTDYVNICGNNSMICNATITKSLNAIEATEGGMGVAADLFGTILGDPQLILADMVLVPGQSAVTNGFVGDDSPVASLIPEPASWIVLVIGLELIVVLHLAGWAPGVTSAARRYHAPGIRARTPSPINAKAAQ